MTTKTQTEAEQMAEMAQTAEWVQAIITRVPARAVELDRVNDLIVWDRLMFKAFACSNTPDPGDDPRDTALLRALLSAFMVASDPTTRGDASPSACRIAAVRAFADDNDAWGWLADQVIAHA